MVHSVYGVDLARCSCALQGSGWVLLATRRMLHTKRTQEQRMPAPVQRTIATDSHEGRRDCSMRHTLGPAPLQELLDSGRAPLKPLPSARRVVWAWNEAGELLFGRLPRCRTLGSAWAAVREKSEVLLTSKDALLDAADPLPFLGLHYMQVGLLATAM